MNLKGEFSILLRGEKDRRTPMKSLNEDIKTGNFKPVYLLYGEEAYLKKQYRDRITKAIFPDGDTVNYAYYEGKGINPGELIDLAETMPFFAKRRLIVVENSGFFKNATPDLADYIKTMPDTACFLFVENEADKRGKMYKAVKSKGRVVEMARQDEKTLLYWVAGNVFRIFQGIGINVYFSKIDMDAEMAKNVEKNKKRMEKMGLDPNTTMQDIAKQRTSSINNKTTQAKSSNKNSGINKNANTVSKKDSPNNGGNKNYKKGSIAAYANMLARDTGDKDKKEYRINSQSSGKSQTEKKK